MTSLNFKWGKSETRGKKSFDDLNDDGKQVFTIFLKIKIIYEVQKKRRWTSLLYSSFHQEKID